MTEPYSGNMSSNAEVDPEEAALVEDCIRTLRSARARTSMNEIKQIFADYPLIVAKIEDEEEQAEKEAQAKQVYFAHAVTPEADIINEMIDTDISPPLCKLDIQFACILLEKRLPGKEPESIVHVSVLARDYAKVVEILPAKVGTVSIEVGRAKFWGAFESE